MTARRIVAWALVGGALALAWWADRPRGARADEPVDWRREPLQLPTDRAPFLLETSHGSVRVVPRASYDVAARVEGSERYRFDATSFLSPLDLVLTWGELPEPRWHDALDYSQSSRFFFWRTPDLELDRKYVITHSANTHVIPSTANLRRALLSIDPGDDVRLTGLLVDVSARDLSWRTSTVRTDHGDHGCEILWVESVQVGLRRYGPEGSER
jgi:hypothetical protein